jgi:phage-related protein
VLTYSIERTIKFYRTAGNSCLVFEFIDSLEDRPAAKVAAVFKMIESLPMVPAKFFKKLGGHDVWECLVEYEGTAYRFLGFLEKVSVVLLTHGFTKRTQKRPDREIKKAEEFKRDWERRNR